MGLADLRLDSGALSQEPQDTGEHWGEGGFVAKTLDVLSTPQYAVAGGLNAAIHGQDIGAGMAHGVETRASNRALFEEAGLKGGWAWGLGTLADLATDPVNYIPFAGLLGMGEKAARVGKIGSAFMRFAPEVIAESGSKVDPALNLWGVARRMVARDAHAAALGGHELATAPLEVKRAAVEAARVAAKGLGPITSPNWGETMRVLGSALDDPTVLQKASPGLVRDLGNFQSLAIKKAGEAFKDVTRYGPAGPIFADALEAASVRMQKLQGERLSYYVNQYAHVLSKFGKEDLARFTGALDGDFAIAELPDELQALAKSFKKDAAQVYEELTKYGVRELDLQRTGRFLKLAAGEKAVIKEILDAGGDISHPAAAALHSPEARDMLTNWAGRGIKIVTDPETGLHAVTLGLQQVADYVPRMLTKRGRDWLRAARTMGEAKLVKTITSDPEFAHLTPEMVRDLASTVGNGKFFSPDDIIESFQVRRYGAVQFPSWMWEHDPNKWMRKWFEHSSRRIAHASVWGGTNENFRAVMEGMAQVGDNATHDVQVAWNHYLGKAPQDGAAGVVARINKTSSLLFLGPRTAIIQLTQLANPVASFGFRNTMAAIGTFVKDAVGSQDIMRQVQRSGALIPSVERLYEGGAVTDKALNWWHQAMGIRQMDSAARAISAIAASFKVQELTDDIVKLGGKLTPRIERELGALGLNARELVQQGHALTDDQILNAMMNGANLTQFATRTQDLPRMFHGTAGRFFLKFKSFAFQQADYIHREIGTLIANPKTRAAGVAKATRYLAAFGWLYSGVARQLSAFSNKDNPTDDDVAYIQNMLLTGALGVWGDTVVGATKGNTALWLGLIAGPNSAMISNFGAAPVAAVKNADLTELKPLVPAILRQPWNYAQTAASQ